MPPHSRSTSDRSTSGGSSTSGANTWSVRLASSSSTSRRPKALPALRTGNRRNRMETSTSVGERIAYYRRRRGLSQVKLAGLLGRSESWLSQVERGARQIDRVSVLLKVAAALDVPVTELTPESLVSKAPEQHPTVRAVRLLLCRPDALWRMFALTSGVKRKRRQISRSSSPGQAKLGNSPTLLATGNPREQDRV